MNATNTIKPGHMLGFEAVGETVRIRFERLALELERKDAIAMAYWLSELVD